jgi:predicted dehydrogenase
VDLASHTLDLLDFLLGPIAGARGLAANLSGIHRVEDVVAASFTIGSGAVGSGLWNMAAATREDRVEIQGSRGKLAFATFENAPIRWSSAAGEREFAIPHPAHIQQPLIQSIVDELNGEGRCPSTGESGARANLVMDAILGDFRATAP